MAGATKITTCCYCGTRAMMRLGGKIQHELVCGNCGAPLHTMKWLKQPKPAAPQPQRRPTMRDDDYRHRKRSKPRKRRKGLFQKAFEEIIDVVEDIFD